MTSRTKTVCGGRKRGKVSRAPIGENRRENVPVMRNLGNGATVTLAGAALAVNGQLDLGLFSGDDGSDAEEGIHLRLVIGWVESVWNGSG